MNLLKVHGPKLLLLVAALLCGAIAYNEYSSGENKPEELVEAQANAARLKEMFAKGKVSDKYAYAKTAADSLNYQEQVANTLEMKAATTLSDVPAYVAYQRPAKPVIDPDSKPKKDGDFTTHQTAVMGTITDITTEVDHGFILLAFKVPDASASKYMTPVRVEVFRGEGDAKNIDLRVPFSTVELASEDETVDAVAATAPEVKAATEEPAAESSGSKRRAARHAAENKEAAKPSVKPKDTEKPEEIPPQFAASKIFKDSLVDEKREYFYQLRLISKISVPPNKFGSREIREEAVAGVVTKIIVVDPPTGVTPVKPIAPNSNAALFAAALTAPVSRKAKANFEVRLAGTEGTIDPIGTPDFKRTKTYKGRFAVRAWVKEAQEWKEIQIMVAPDEPLKGALTYKVPDPKPKDPNRKITKEVPFDTRYKLVEIKMAETLTEKTSNEPELDKDGNPVFDPATKQPKMKQIVRQEKLPNEVAVLEDVATHKLEEFPKRQNFEDRAKAVKYYQALADQQARESKEIQAKMQKLREKLRAAEEERKAKAAADAATQLDPNAPATPVPVAPPMPRNPAAGRAGRQ